MSSRLRNAVIIAALTALCCGGGPAALARPAAGCDGASCVGKDPKVMGCTADQSVIAKLRIDSYWTLQLVHSTTCHARWAAWVSTGTSGGHAVIREFRELKTPYGYYVDKYQAKTVDLSKTGTFRTAMNRNTSDDRHRAQAETFGYTEYKY